MYNAFESHHAGWAIDGSELTVVEPGGATRDDHLEIRALIAVRDSDGYLYRVSYQATVLGQTL
jgi:hypothetical protein